MIVRDLDPAECLEMLSEAHLGRLGCAQADQPYVVPAHFYFDREENCLFGFSTVGQKIDWMRANPKVCVEFERVVDQFHWTTLVVFGRYEEVRDWPAEPESSRRAYELLRPHPSWWLPAAAKLDSGDEPHAFVVYRIRIDRVTGRRADRPDLT